MKDIILEFEDYPVLIGDGVITRTADYAPSGRQAFIVHQSSVKAHAKTVASALQNKHDGIQVHQIEVRDGEQAKELDQIKVLYQKAMQAKLERTDVIFAVGGGCVGDAAGFFAATYMRGLPLVHVSTTLLAQVDSSDGGKVGVNFESTKNMVGAFHPPKLVVDDIRTLQSLSDEQISNGLAEVAKYGLIRDSDFFSYLEKNIDRLRAKDPEVLMHIVQQSVQHKNAVVVQDPRETGIRMTLNYGHTLGHGIETVTGMAHGFAIAVGMNAAGILAVQKGLMKKNEWNRQNELLQAAGLPLTATGDSNAIMEKVRQDKKRSAGKPRMVLLEGIGRCSIHHVTEKEAQDALEQVLT